MISIKVEVFNDDILVSKAMIPIFNSVEFTQTFHYSGIVNKGIILTGYRLTSHIKLIERSENEPTSPEAEKKKARI